MVEAEKITGAGIQRIFEQLRDNRTVLKMSLPARDYERLTMVIRLLSDRGKSFFLIDYPQDFREAISKLRVWELRFECLGKDRVPYTFKTSGGQLSGNDVWIPFPAVVERGQRRRNFRLTTPLDTQMDFLLESTTRRVTVLNVSQEGALVSFPKDTPGNPLLEEGEILRSLILTFPCTEGDQMVYIKEASVSRVERDPSTRQYRYGIRFIHMERDEINILKNTIYKVQREFLRKR